MKVCYKCQQEKPLDAFYVHKYMADGRLGKCKECCIAYAKQRAIDHPEILAANERKRHLKPARKAKVKEYQKKDRKTNPDKHRARRIVAGYIRKGYMTRKPCVHCGTEPAHAHHPDYSKELTVTWLCVRCHHNEHKRLRQLGKDPDVDLPT